MKSYISRESNGFVPSYIKDIVKDNRRTYASVAQVCIQILDNYQVSKCQLKDMTNSQRDAAIFTATNNYDETYDAYEKDIALVSFYFKQPTAFEYTR